MISIKSRAKKIEKKKRKANKKKERKIQRYAQTTFAFIYPSISIYLFIFYTERRFNKKYSLKQNIKNNNYSKKREIETKTKKLFLSSLLNLRCFVILLGIVDISNRIKKKKRRRRRLCLSLQAFFFCFVMVLPKKGARLVFYR